MPRYFHASINNLQTGTRLKPGHGSNHPHYKVIKNAYNSGQLYIENILFTEWAINTRMNPPVYHLFSWTKEVIYEMVRETEFPNLPGRFGSVYLWEDVSIARQFLNEYHGGKGFIYECSVSSDQSSLRFDQNYWNSRQLSFLEPLWPQLQFIFGDAKAYYSQTPSQKPMWEILARDPVHIVKRV